MTKIWKQSLSLLLAAVLVLALIPAQPLTANAANGYQWSYTTNYEWLNGTFETADTDGVYEVGQAYDWYATLAPTKGAYTVVVSANVVNDATGETISTCDKNVDVAKGPAKTAIISYADFPELTEDLAGTFTLTCKVGVGSKFYAQLQARFTREAPAAPAITYGAEWQYLTGYEWIQGEVATDDDDYIYGEGQAYDWEVKISPTKQAGTANVVAEIRNINNEVVGSVTKEGVEFGKAPAKTVLVTAADFAELTGELIGDFQLTVKVYMGTKLYATGTFTFGRSGAYVEETPEEPSEPETPTDPSEPETPTDPSEPETPATPTAPGEVVWTYANSSETETYEWLTGAVTTANITGIYNGWDAYDWAVTLCPTKAAATITVEANVVDHTGAEVGTATKEVEVGKAPAVTTILTAADLKLDNKSLGDYLVTAVIKWNGAPIAQVQFVFGRRIGDAGYSAVEYLKGYEWINGAFNAADEDKSYIGEQPYDWTVSIAPTKMAGAADVTATVVDEHGNVVASLEKTGVDFAKTATTTMLSAAELTELTNDLYGKFAVTTIISIGGKNYVGVYGVFERVEGEWEAPNDPTNPVFTPSSWEACGLPQAIEVLNPGEMAKKVSVQITITKPDGATVTMGKTVDLAVGASAVLANTNQLRSVITERGAEYTVTITGYWKNAYQEVEINETLTYVWAEHTDTEVIPGKAATCTETGLTDGTFCNGCEGTIVEQEEIPVDPNAHNFVDGTCACGAVHSCVAGEPVIENMVESTWDKVGTYDEVTYCEGCGEELSRVTKDAPLNPFYSNGMELNCQLTLNFVIKYDTLPFNSIAAINASGYYAVVTRIDAAGNRNDTTIPASAWQGHTKNRMRIPYSDWAPKQMTDALEIAIYDNNGEKISVVYETSVRGIAMSEIEQYIAIGGYDSYVTLLVDMLNYGTASQNNFGYNTGDCANALLPDEWKAYATPDVSYGARKDNSGVAFYQSTAFALESRVEMQLVLTNNFGVDRSQVVAEISYTTRTGKLVEKTVSGADFMPHTKGRFKLIIDWMDIPDCQQNVTIVFKDINGNELGTVTESVMSALGYYSELVPNDALYPAMIKFINSATAYFAG